ncbi:Histidine kinase 1 [Melia azedarach]|uniref:Histidine kinase 1 n=1 Tax=Melia azedarach TaxID=155640 RepID=A0ACC1XTB4_MELAZ|nr:Histidine kinase 1 [Melia azedarach]
MATPLTLKKVFDSISGMAGSWRRYRAPRGRRMVQTDAHAQQDDEFQHAAARCLSSYYSVFVARLAIMIMLAILIGLLTVLTWHFTRVYTTKSLDTLAYGLRYELLQRPLLRMWNIVNSTAEITAAQVKLSEYVIKQYSKPANQAEQIELYEVMRDVTWAMFASRKALNAITINYKNGFVQAFHRDHRSNNTFYIYSDLSNYSIGTGGLYDSNMLSSRQGWNDQSIKGNISAIWYQEPLDPVTGSKIGKARPIPPDDLINIAGISQVPDGVASWHVAVSKYTDSPLLSAALPVWDPSNKSIVAVVGVTTALYSVGQLMKELVVVHSGHIYLTSQEGYLLATSTNAPLLMNSSSGPKLVKAVDSDNHVIQMGAQWLEKEYGNKLPPGHVIHVQNAKLGHKQYYMDSFFLNLKRLPIVGVIIIPREYIMGKADERAYKTLIILISASVCILIIGCICILILTNGVSKEMKLRAELISHLDARRKAEASNNYKSQFLANMSHELRTPMAAIIGLLEILKSDDHLTNEQYSTVCQIKKSSFALLRLLNRILDLSKVESGKMELENTEFDLRKELEELVDMFSVQCSNHNVETVLDLSDDIPRKLRGDPGRVFQIFSNLINNSIKFTTSGHIIIRGWCEKQTTFNNTTEFPLDQKKLGCGFKTKLKQQANHTKNCEEEDNKLALCFEVDDTGCGIDQSKWETVFESFEQGDTSTTRLHGGTGLGLSIVRTLVNKMGGEIKVVKKNGPGTLMQLYLLLGVPSEEGEQSNDTDFSNTVVLLALTGSTGRRIMSQWLHKRNVPTLEASEWNELTQILREFFHPISPSNGFDTQHSFSEPMKAEMLKIKAMRNPVVIVVVDISLLDLSSDVWREQLDYLDIFSGIAKFAWVVKHESNYSITMDLCRKGHDIVVNKPLYRGKMIHILESARKGRTLEMQASCLTATKEGNIGVEQSENVASSNASQDQTFRNCSVELTEACPEESSSSRREDLIHTMFRERHQVGNSCPRDQGSSPSNSSGKVRNILGGLRILLVEDTLLLQIVATKMLEQAGAKVDVVEDGLQAVEAINNILSAEKAKRTSLLQGSQPETSDSPRYDLILMDCQMPKMDGYEATIEIRKSEKAHLVHPIPIVALTAHAMVADEKKCLGVGMNAYLTKPIDYERMVKTIIKLTKKKAAEANNKVVPS